MGVPQELRETIIIHAIAAEQADSPFANTPDNLQFPQQFDFSVDVNGLRCHSMKSFSLLFVNKQVYNEAQPLVFRYSSVLLYVEVTHSARSVGFIPFVLDNIPNIVKANVREVAVKFGNVAVPVSDLQLITPPCNHADEFRNPASSFLVPEQRGSP